MRKLLALSVLVLLPKLALAQTVCTNTSNTCGGGGVSAGGNNSFVGANSFLDGANFSIKNTADPTKVLQFSLSGVTTGNTITPFSFSGTTAAPTTTVTGVLSLPTGSISTASIIFAGGTAGSGIYGRSTSTDITANGLWAAEFGVASLGLQLPSNSQIGFSPNTTAGVAVDAFMKRKAAATIQMGLDANGAVVSQQLQGANGITGTDIAGGNLALGGQVGTGAGAGSQTFLNRAVMLGTGTSAQSNVNGTGVCESKTLSNTTATATAVANIISGSNSAGGARASITVTCTNGTEFAASTVTSFQGFANKAGTITLGTATTQAEANGASTGGTLNCTVAPTWVANGNSVDLKVTPVITGAATTTTVFVAIENLGPGAVACK